MPGACDPCRRRKVKCDATSPCGNCRISQIVCERTTLPRKRGRPAKSASNHGSPQSQGGPRTTTSSNRGVEVAIGDTFVIQSPSEPSTLEIASPIAIQTPMRHGSAVARTAGPEIRSDGASTTSRTATTVSTGTISAGSPNIFVLDAVQVYQKLIPLVHAQLVDPGDTIAALIGRCVDAWVQYIFPNTPIAHEPTLRSAAALFHVPSGSEFSGGTNPPTVDTLRKFTLITALCALVVSVMPEKLIGATKDLTWPFYHASRAMLRLYEEYDLEFPESSSYTIRIWQSAALQNLTGRDKASWHIHGAGIMLAVRARLYEEETLRGLPPLEAQLLRINFWLMCLADKTAAAFEARPCLIHGDYLSDRLTLREQGDYEESQLDPARPCNGHLLEHRLLIGFHLKRRLWAAAADMIREIRQLGRRDDSVPYPGVGFSIDMAAIGEIPPSTASDVIKLSEMYRTFVGYVDDLPCWLQSPDQGQPKLLDGSPTDLQPDVAEYQAASFWAQRSNIMTVYHCMRLVMLQICLEIRLPSVVGLGNEPVSWAVHKLDIARDFLREVQITPFVCFKVQGEPAVERVRRVGSILLSIVNDAPSPAIELRARKLFEQLLDILASLDSKASDDLETLGYFPGICE